MPLSGWIPLSHVFCDQEDEEEVVTAETPPTYDPRSLLPHLTFEQHDNSQILFLCYAETPCPLLSAMALSPLLL